MVKDRLTPSRPLPRPNQVSWILLRSKVAMRQFAGRIPAVGPSHLARARMGRYVKRPSNQQRCE